LENHQFEEQDKTRQVYNTHIEIRLGLPSFDVDKSVDFPEFCSFISPERLDSCIAYVFVLIKIYDSGMALESSFRRFLQRNCIEYNDVPKEA